jgi:hypothetical protein
LLKSEEILSIYDRYNASEHEDEWTQELLAALLDTVEARRTIVPGSPLDRPANEESASPAPAPAPAAGQ